MSKKYKVAIETLGCKLNQYDSEAIIQELDDGQMDTVNQIEDADIVIVNTCTVTNNGDADSRKVIRQIHRANPEAKIMVTGCYAQLDPDSIKDIEGVAWVGGNVNKYQGTAEALQKMVQPAFSSTLPGLNDCGAGKKLALEQGAELGAEEEKLDLSGIGDVGDAEHAILKGHGSRIRGFLKIQDGCDFRCSYCIIPYARGNNRSVSLEHILVQAQTMAQQGMAELGITGVHIGTWGRDMRPRLPFSHLIKALAEQGPDVWYRISSLDSPELDDVLIEMMKQYPHKIVPHLHVPLQSGAQEILKKMRRRYSPQAFNTILHKVVDQVPGVTLGTDIIVGFPGETDEHFAETLANLEESPLHYLHVFRFSKRSGTPAASMTNQVPGDIATKRSKILRDWSDQRWEKHQTII